MLIFIIFILFGCFNTPYLLPASATVAPFDIDEIVEPSKKETLTFTKELSEHLIETVSALAATNNQIDWKEVAKVMSIKAERPVIAAQCRDRWNKYDNPALHPIDFSLKDNALILQALIQKTAEGYAHAEVCRMLSSQFNLKLAPGVVQSECRKQRKILSKADPSMPLPVFKRTKRAPPKENAALVTLSIHQPAPQAGDPSAQLTPFDPFTSSPLSELGDLDHDVPEENAALVTLPTHQSSPPPGGLSAPLAPFDPFTSSPLSELGDLGFELFSADDPFMHGTLAAPDRPTPFDGRIYERLTPILESFLAGA